jgi:magnesium-transporting ATPase (P-type)
MTLIVKEPGTNKLLMMTKGADSVMMPMITSDKGMVQQHLDEFAIEGLRTLVMG